MNFRSMVRCAAVAAGTGSSPVVNPSILRPPVAVRASTCEYAAGSRNSPAASLSAPLTISLPSGGWRPCRILALFKRPRISPHRVMVETVEGHGSVGHDLVQGLPGYCHPDAQGETWDAP